ncbi:PGF-CTERM sorting domain-containing protein [Methanocella sp. MCL-LM]|uniref:PGF-CTERM sorting domain-containing protein n=1 Tax=Methanocella sp. MCL-LM TaxID=3412035 RepID=UPI003C719110
MKNTTKAVLIALAVLAIIAITIDVTAVKPTYNQTLYQAPAMGTAHPSPGAISGRLTTSNTSAGLPHAYVAVVDANNNAMAYYVGESDANGFYQFPIVNNTFGLTLAGTGNNYSQTNGNAYTAAYKIYANHSLFGEGYSNSFPVEERSTAPANVVIIPQPAKIVVTAERNNIAADDADKVKIYAYATDALGDPVADGTLIDFKVNQTPWVANQNGSLSRGGNYEGVQTLTNVPTKGGWANVTFGWVNELYAGNNSSIMAYYGADPLINGSTSIYFNPTLASWFGSVQDSFGKPYGGTVVTLHLMGNLQDGTAVEYYNMTTTAYVDLPYPGSYVFDNIELNSSITYGYATAQADIGDGVIYYGTSQNYSLNKSRTSSGFIVLHVPMPDAIEVTADPDTILVGGDQSIITAQLFLNGKPYKRSGVTVTFFENNTTIAYLPSVKTNVTNSAGQAAIILTSNATKGDVIVTGYTKIGISRNLTDDALVHVVGWGTISGMVTDKNKNGIPNATVKLWTTKWANDTLENQKLVKSPENPQYTVSRPEIAAIGTYTYYRVPSGVYNLTAEKADSSGNVHMWFAWVNLTVGTATNNVALPDYVVPTVATATPTAVVTPTATATATAVPVTPTPTPTPAPGFETVFALAGLLGVAYLIMRKEN